MPTPDRRDDQIQKLERVYALPEGATLIERAILYEPKTGNGWRHRCMLLTRWGRSLGLDPYQP